MRVIRKTLFITALLTLMNSGDARARGSCWQSREGTMLTLTKKLFYENRDLNLITGMKLGKFGMGETCLMVLGNGGACLLTIEGKPVKCISYTSPAHSVQVVELPEQNTYVFVAGGMWGEPAAVVMDSEGKTKWRYDSRFKAMGAPAVIDSDVLGGRVVALFEEDCGLLFFDLDTGKLLRVSQPSASLRDLRAIDLDGDGRRELVASDAEGRLVAITPSSETVLAT